MVNCISDSKFHVWRCLVALVHADGQVDAKEKDWLSHCLSSQMLHDEQKNILREDFKSPPALESLLPKITEIKDFSHLLHMANILFHIDGEMTEAEKKMMASLNDYYSKYFGMANRRELAKGIVMAYEDSWANKNPSAILSSDWDSAQSSWWGRPRWARGRFGANVFLIQFLGQMIFRYPWVAVPLLLSYCAWTMHNAKLARQASTAQHYAQPLNSQDNASKALQEQ